MGNNISFVDQTAAFIDDLQNTNKKIPMFIATDQEGGTVKRVSWDFTDGQYLWANNTNDEICKIGKDRANILSELGINLNFAPVVDLRYNGSAFINNRTISSDPKIVLDKSKEYVRCSQQNDIFATLKHFPGHGSTSEDSHITLPVINKSKEDWLKSDAIPFKEIPESKMIMVGHLKFTDIDSKNAASQSEIIIEDVLRDELGYDGVVITDAMGQLHGSTGISVENALKNSYNAGVDIVLYVSISKSEKEIIEILANLIESGEVSEEKINASLVRILKLKREIR